MYRLLCQCRTEPVLGHIEFQQRRNRVEGLGCIWERGLPMQRRGKTDATTPHMGQHPNVVRTRHRGDFSALRKAACDAQIGLHDIQSAFL